MRPGSQGFKTISTRSPPATPVHVVSLIRGRCVTLDAYVKYRRIYPTLRMILSSLVQWAEAPLDLRSVSHSRRTLHPLTVHTLVAPPDKAHPLGQTVLTRRNLLWTAAGSAAALAFYAGEISRHELEVVDLTIHLPRLPDAFAGMKIVQISDFHFAEYTEAAFLERVVRRVNEAAADLVVLTGDFVSTRPLPKRFSIRMAYHCAEILSRVSCPLRYAILGNHDALVGAPAVIDALRTHGIPVLINSCVPIERGGERLWLAGIRDVLGGATGSGCRSAR